MWCALRRPALALAATCNFLKGASLQDRFSEKFGKLPLSPPGPRGGTGEPYIHGALERTKLKTQNKHVAILLVPGASCIAAPASSSSSGGHVHSNLILKGASLQTTY